MKNFRSQQLREQQRQRWRQNSRNRRQRMSIEQRQQELSRRRSNYNQNKQKGKHVQTSCTPTIAGNILMQKLFNIYVKVIYFYNRIKLFFV